MNDNNDNQNTNNGPYDNKSGESNNDNANTGSGSVDNGLNISNDNENQN